MVDIKAGNNPVIDTTEFLASDKPEAFAELGTALEKVDDGNTLGGFLRLDDNKTADISDDKYVINYDDKLLSANTPEGHAARESFRKFAVDAKSIYKNFKLNGAELSLNTEQFGDTLDAIEAQLPKYEKDPAAPAIQSQVAPAAAKPAEPVAPVANVAPATLPTINFSANMGKNTMTEITTKLDTGHILFQMDGDKLAFKIDFNKIINDDKYRGEFILIANTVSTFINEKLQKNGITSKNAAQKLTQEQIKFIGMLGESYVLAESLNSMSGTANMGKNTSTEITTKIDANHEFFKMNGDKLSLNVDVKKLGSDATYRQSFINKSELVMGFVKQKLETLKLKFDKLPPEQQEFLVNLRNANSAAKTLQGVAKRTGAENTPVKPEGAAQVAAPSNESGFNPLALLATPGLPSLVAIGAIIYTFDKLTSDE